ncbi:S9 family peptidase [Phototrophicus methaneseepsis]|uniref:S9 family peptidase n=1 Tax=Phototrophicus methaneseepsis TaxID=2710758 RepID=A0A7S8E8C4_9CHLR|nr:S9 family peptidase [Phototrophicus methaneseepsis]QPC82263.1 S9 family peptidase [Phototrophicus methaneseepsis]
MSEKRPITAEDLNRIIYIEDPQVSPDGKWIAYVHVTPNPGEKRYTSNIWLAATDGTTLYQLTRGGKDTTPRWSPDGSALAFVSTRNGVPQIFLLPVNAIGGEARQLTSNKNGAAAPAWSPDGSMIAYLSSMNAEERAKEDSGEAEEPPQDELESKYRKDREAETKKAFFDPMFIERIPFRQGTSYMDDRRQQVYVIATAEGLEGDAAKARRLTSLAGSYTPPQWSPDGSTLYTSRPWDLEKDESFRWGNIYSIDITSGEETRFLADDEHSYYGALPSPDGKWLAAIRSESIITDDVSRFLLIPLEGDGEPVVLNETLDRSIGGYEWTDDGRLFASVADNGVVNVFEIDIENTTFKPVVDGRMYVRDFSVSNDGSVAYSFSTPMNPNELGYKATNGEQVVLTEANKKLLDEVFVQETYGVRYASPSGTEIQGWYILPVGYEEGKEYPLALNIHGGPHAMWGDSERSMWHEWQFHAARGYVVFYCNPRGSDGYGESFLNALHSDWGNIAMDDIMAGVDLMIEKGMIDVNHMAVTGGSYGGYMTAWIVGHTDRFVAAVSQRGVYNLTSFYGTSDVPVLISAEFDAEPWENPEKLWEHSPLAYAHNVTTPLLIIHSENDFRVPIEQGEQLFAWVRRATNTPVKLVRYPREGHELSRSGEPNHRISRLTQMVNWFDTYCFPEKFD